MSKRLFAGRLATALPRLALCAGLLASGTFGVTPAEAQGAADVATARQLARDGIKLFQQKKYQEALERLQRAQALYDAPVHLLYIARCQAQLGLVVDAAETYRKLQRVRLEPGAPDAFRQAQADAEPELAQVEPRIPFLRIEVEPADVEGLEIKLDDTPVPSAALGVDRPANPGKRVLRATAPGYFPAETEVDLQEGKRETLKLVLKKDPNAVLAPPAPDGAQGGPGPAGQAGPDTSAGSPPAASDEPEWPRHDWGFYAGARGGLMLPMGSLARDPASGNEIAVTDQFQTGGGFGARLGFRYLNFTGIFYYEQSFMKPGSSFDQALTTPSTEVTTTTGSRSIGFALLVGSEVGPGIGGYGELGVAFAHQLSASMDVSEAGNACTGSIDYAGTAFRLGGALTYGIADGLQIEIPYATVELGSFKSVDIAFDSDTRCTRPGVLNGDDPATSRVVAETGNGSFDIADGNTATHFLVGIGVGAAWVGP